MSKQRSSSSKFAREIKKRERQKVKSEKAELKRQRREGGVSAPEPPTPDSVAGTKGNALGFEDQDIAPSPPEN